VRVSSPISNDSPVTGRKRRPSLPMRAALFALLVGLVAGGAVPARADDDLNAARDKVRKQMATAKKQVAADSSALGKAKDALKASQAALAKARSELAELDGRVSDAKAADETIAAQLAAAETATQTAAAAETRAAQDVSDQRELIGTVARAAYQQQTNLLGLSVVLGSDTPRDLATRLQWNTMIFDVTAADYNRLDQLEQQLEQAHQARVDAEAVVAEKRKESADNLAALRSLAAKAEAKRAAVADLVAKKKKLEASAQDELEGSKKQYAKLQKAEKAITAKIRNASGNYSNPNGFIKPVDAAPGSGFGMRFHPILHYWRMHWGTDFGASCGAPIRAMANGKVIQAGWTTYGFGNFTLISYGHMLGANLVSGYAHQSRIIVHAGQHVKQGQIVGYVGTTGLSTGCHLHLQIYRNGTRVNPMHYL